MELIAAVGALSVSSTRTSICQPASQEIVLIEKPLLGTEPEP